MPFAPDLVRLGAQDKLVFKALAIVISMVLLTPGCNAQSVTYPPASGVRMKESAAMTFPGTPQELWTRVWALLRTNGGFVTREEVEDVLGLQFSNTEKDGERRALGARAFHSMKQELPGLGLLRVGMYDDPRKVSLSMSWGPEEFATPTCLDLMQVTADVNAAGWGGGARSRFAGAGSVLFFRTEDIAENSRVGKPLDVFAGTSQLALFVPNQFSHCVNGVGMSIWRP